MAIQIGAPGSGATGDPACGSVGETQLSSVQFGVVDNGRQTRARPGAEYSPGETINEFSIPEGEVVKAARERDFEPHPIPRTTNRERRRKSGVEFVMTCEGLL